jgi:hypothetical protein
MVEKIGGGAQLQYLQCPGGRMPRPDGSCPPRLPAKVRPHKQEKPNPCPPEQVTIVKTRDKKTGQEIVTRRVQNCFEERAKLNPETGSYEATRPRQVGTRPRRVGTEPGLARPR